MMEVADRSSARVASLYGDAVANAHSIDGGAMALGIVEMCARAAETTEIINFATVTIVFFSLYLLLDVGVTAIAIGRASTKEL
jgi:hypothetical protein